MKNIEKWDVYDKLGNKTGATKTRTDVWNENEYHLGVSLWIVNSNGEILIQKRASCKRINPNIYCIVGGSVIAGETSEQSCIREVKEEIGIDVSSDTIHFLKRSYGENSIYDDFITIKNFSITDVIIQYDEVSEVKWVSLNEIQKLFENKVFMLNNLDELLIVKQFIDLNI